MTAADRPAGLPEVGRIAARILSTLAPWVDNPPTRADVEQVGQRIATGLDGMYLGPYRKLQERVEELELPDPDFEDLRLGVQELFANIQTWHYSQPDHLGWAVCQHPICRAIQEFPWE